LAFTRGIPTFGNESEGEAIGVFGVFPKIFSSCIGPIGFYLAVFGDQLQAVVFDGIARMFI